MVSSCVIWKEYVDQNQCLNGFMTPRFHSITYTPVSGSVVLKKVDLYLFLTVPHISGFLENVVKS